MDLSAVEPSGAGSSTIGAFAVGPVRHKAEDQPDGAGSRPKTLVRVLHVINGEHYSGAERVQDLLAQRLPEFGYEAGFVCLKPGGFAARRQSREAPLFDLPMTSRLALGTARRIAALARRERFSLLHAHTPRSLLVARLASAMSGLPLAYHVHSPTLRDSTRRWRNRVNGFVERCSLIGGVQLIAVSHSLGRYLNEMGFPDRRVTVVPNGVPASEFLPPRRHPADRWTLGMAALFRPRKGAEVLIDALAILRRQGIDATLRAIGPFETPEYEREVKQRAQAAGVADWITWTGFSQQVPAELARLDLFVLPSLFGEGLPMVVLEAMAAGAPVITTRVEGAPEAIRDRVDGVLVEPGDAASLAAGVAEVIRGGVDWAALRESAWRRQRDQFSDRSMAAGVARVYRARLGV